jgi:hypothetical protein
MILTLTANPSLDRTIELSGPVLRGQVQRAVWAGQQPGGKGVNVSRAVAAADRDTLAVLPGDIDDPVLTGLDAIGLAHRSVPTGTPLRSNITVTEPDGTTTKINEPGSPLSAQTQNALLDLVAEQAAGASWVVLAGSLPPGVDDDFYARAIKRIRELVQSAAGRRRHLRCSSDCGPDGLTGSHQTQRRRTCRAPQRLQASCTPPVSGTILTHATLSNPSTPPNCTRSPTASSPHRSSRLAPHRPCSTRAAPAHGRSLRPWAPAAQCSPSRTPPGMPSIRRWRS